MCFRTLKACANVGYPYFGGHGQESLGAGIHPIKNSRRPDLINVMFFETRYLCSHRYLVTAASLSRPKKVRGCV